MTTDLPHMEEVGCFFYATYRSTAIIILYKLSLNALLSKLEINFYLNTYNKKYL